jgi:DNA-binding transcriptional ArsR family regulator
VTQMISSRRAWRSRGVAGSSRTAGRAGHELLRRRDLEVLAWLVEQYGARVDQLEVLMGAGPRTVQRTVTRLRGAGLVRTERVLVGEPAWVLATGAGMAACNSGFGVWRPRLGSLAHVAAVNDVRLHVQGRAPSTEWIAERLLARDRLAGEHLPDGVAITEGRRVAIEVELTVKSRRRVTAILDELTTRFDAVLYFCAAGPHRQLTELAATGRWPTLGVRELPALTAGTSTPDNRRLP